MKKASARRVEALIKQYALRIRLEPCVAEEFVRAYSLIRVLKQFNISHVFVENHIDERGGQTFPNFCFFSKEFHAEASTIKEVTNEQQRDFFVVSLKEGLAKVSVNDYAEFDFEKANDKSRLTIAFSLNSGESFFLNAAGKNCDDLFEIYRACLMPLL